MNFIPGHSHYRKNQGSILIKICGKQEGVFRQFDVFGLGEVAKFGTDYFLSNIKFLAERKREFTTKFAILPNGCYKPLFY
jgi:hypothetical protein